MKLLLGILCVLLVLAVAPISATAHGELDAQGAQIITSLSEPIAFAPGISGDFYYSTGDGQISPAIGAQLCTFFGGVLEGRGMVVMDADNTDIIDKVGAGIGVNLPKLSTLLGGEWISKILNPSIGAATLYDLRDRALDFGAYVSIVKVEF